MATPPVPLPTELIGFRLIDGADLNAIIKDTVAAAAAASVTIPSLPMEELGPRVFNADHFNTLLQAIQTIATAKSVTVILPASIIPGGYRMLGGTEINKLSAAVAAIS